MTTLTSTLFLSTDSVTNPPQAFLNKANVSWNVDWDQIFHGKKGLCKIHCQLLGSAGIVTDLDAVWDTLIGTVRCSFSSIYSHNQNGVILANIIPQSIANSTTNFYYTANTEHAQPTINIPFGKEAFNIQLVGIAENSLLSNVPDYGILLTFEWISDEVIKKNISSM